MARVRASEAGFTLLELVLSLALGTVVVTAFFMNYQGFMSAVSMSADDVGGTTSVSELFDYMSRDLDQATALTVQQSFLLTATVNGQAVSYRLVSASPGTESASRDVHVERGVAGVWTSIGPRRAIANFHPYAGTLKTATGADTSGYGPVDFFVYDNTPGRAPQVILHAVVQSKDGAPVRYVRARSTPRVL